MDDTDRKLMLLMAENPRMHYREIARRLGISRQAVHHRWQILKETGVIKGMIAGVSVSYLDAVPVSVFGRSEAASTEKTLDQLGKSDLTRRVVIAGGNYVYVVGFLRNISELDGYVQFVRRAAEMPQPTVGVYCLDDGLMPSYSVDGAGKGKEDHRKLSVLDLKIVASLRDNARRPIAQIAKMVGASSKTVRRHLDDMISDGSLDMSIPSDFQSGGDMLLIMHVTLRDGAEKREVGRRLLSKHHFLDQYIRTHSNIPNLLIWIFWSAKISDVREVLRETEGDEDVASVMLNFVFLERVYHTWRDELPAVQMRMSEKARKHD